MSPHTRARHAALAAACLTLLAACGSITDPGDVTAEPYYGELMAKRRPTPPPPPPPDPVAHSPVLFVHGWNASASTWTTMVSRFKADGWTDRELVNFSYSYSQSNATTAQLLASKVDSVLAATGATRVQIVTHSMGALSARYYVRNLGGATKVDGLVSLGGPNHGTTTAYLCFQVSCMEMYPGSNFLNALNATDETWGDTRYATWWSACDEVINPDSSVPLAGAVANTQTACITHSALHEDATVYTQVRDFVNRTPTALLASAFER